MFYTKWCIICKKTHNVHPLIYKFYVTTKMMANESIMKIKGNIKCSLNTKGIGGGEHKGQIEITVKIVDLT